MISIWAIYEDEKSLIPESKQVLFGSADCWTLQDALDYAKNQHPDADHYVIGETNGLGGSTGPERDGMAGH